MKTVTNQTNQLAKSKSAKSIKSTSLFKQKGASAIEYAVIAALIVVALWGAVELLGLGEAFDRIFSDIADALSGSAAGG